MEPDQSPNAPKAGGWGMSGVMSNMNVSKIVAATAHFSCFDCT
jgi:hypothetical protein